jgi:hypothetical protein
MFALLDGVLDSREVMPSRRSSSSTSSGLMPRVFQINLNYEVMENDLRTTKDVLAVEQENQRVMRESVNTLNAQIQAFLTVRNKNRSIASCLVTYMCDLHFLHCRSWSSVSRIKVIFMFLLGSRRRRGVSRSRNDHHGHRQGHQRLMLATIFLNLAKCN